MIGADRGTFYLQPGEWQVGASYRWFRADEQYQGTRLNPAVTRLRTNVISKLQLLDLGGTRQIDPQWSLSAGIPVTIYASSSRALPATVAGSPRFVQSTRGLGDISLIARRWILPVEQNKLGNFSLGIGLKLPTGDHQARDRFPAATGRISNFGSWILPSNWAIQGWESSWTCRRSSGWGRSPGLSPAAT